MSATIPTAAKFQEDFKYYFQLMAGGHIDIKSATPENPQGRFVGPKTNPNRPGDIFGSDTEMDKKHGPRFRRLHAHEVAALEAARENPPEPEALPDLSRMTVPQLMEFATERGIDVDETMKKVELISWIEQNLAE